MKKYANMFLAILLSVQTYAMDDFQDESGEGVLHLCELSHHDTTILDRLAEIARGLHRASEMCIKHLVNCGRKLSHIKDFESVSDVDQHVTFLNEYINSERKYIYDLRYPGPEVRLTDRAANERILRVKNMINLAKEEKEFALAELPREKVERLEIAHNEIIIKLQNLLLPSNSLQENFVKGSILPYVKDSDVKVKCTIEYISAYLKDDSQVYHLRCFHKTNVLLSEVAKCLNLASQNFQIIFKEICKIYAPLEMECREPFLANELKRDS